MDEFEGFGSFQEVRRYLKRAQDLQKKLDEAQTKVSKSVTPPGMVTSFVRLCNNS